MRFARFLRPAALAAAWVAAVPAIAQEVGTAGAVNPASTGTPPARPTRVLELGSRVVHKERINTAAGGNVQLVFNDKTTMSIGPNSTVVIDEFVYDPRAGTGRLTASMAKGALRFVGGNTSHTGGAEIRTPTATLGIRGGVATIEIVPCSAGAPAAECGTKVTNHFGILSITSAAGTEVIRRPGFVVTIPNAAGAPTAPRRVTQAEVNRTNASLTSRKGQTGGAGTRANERAVDRANVAGPVIAQIGSTVSAIQGQTQAREASIANLLGLSTSPTDATTPTQIRQVVATTLAQQVTAQTSQGLAAATGVGQGSPVTRPVDAGPASPQAFALIFTPATTVSTDLLGTTTGYNAPLLGYSDGGTIGSGSPNTKSRLLSGGLSIDGSGAAQSSAVYVVVGQTSLGPDGQPQADLAFSGSRTLATGYPARSSGNTGAAGSAVSLDSSYAPTSILARGTGNLAGLGTAPTTFDAQVGAARIPTPGGVGANRPAIDSVPNALFGGLVAGLVSTVNNGSGTVGPANIVTGLFDLTFNPATSQFGTTLGINTSGNAEGNALMQAFLDYGKPVDSFYSRPETKDGRGTFVDYQTFGAVDAVGTDGRSTSTVNGSRVDSHRGLFVSSDAVNARAFFPNVTFCQCEYTRWGFWTSETNRTDASGQSLTDLVHLGTWVFGDPTRGVDIPSTGSATYSGHAIATIRNGGAEYVAAGNFQNAVNFGTGTGAAAVVGLDGRSYAGTVAIGQGYNGINGTLASSVPGSSMTLNGQFFRGASGPAGEMGGTVTIGGTPGYAGAGIFAGAAGAPR